jgi:hypothetical protein
MQECPVPEFNAGSFSRTHCVNAKLTGLAQILGQLQASDRNSHSKYWANLQNLGQPCEFLVCMASHAALRQSIEKPPQPSRRASTGGRVFGRDVSIYRCVH